MVRSYSCFVCSALFIYVVMSSHDANGRTDYSTVYSPHSISLRLSLKVLHPESPLYSQRATYCISGFSLRHPYENCALHSIHVDVNQ